MTGQFDANSRCEVFVDPPEVDAGASLSASIEVTTSPPADLAGRPLEIKNHEGVRVGKVTLDRFDGETNSTAPFTLPAPAEAGDYTWFVTPLPDSGDEGSGGGPATQATPFSFTVNPHATRLMVLDLPANVETGSAFTVTAGVKCSSGCAMTGRRVEVLDEDGRVVAGTELTGELWPDSEGLHMGRIDLVAPQGTGLNRWQVRAAAHRSEHPHDSVTAALNVRTVAPADCTLRVEAVDAANEAPLPHASVVMRPYRARADEKGIAELAVARGTYTIYVSCTGHYPVKRDIDVSGDMTTRAPLQAEPAPSKDR